jgi:hypothetical protein
MALRPTLSDGLPLSWHLKHFSGWFASNEMKASNNTDFVESIKK